MADENTDPTYEGSTTGRDREYDAKNLMHGSMAVFPELPTPFNHMYVRFRDLNDNSICSPHSREFGPLEDRREHPAVEVGIKFTF